MQMGGRPPSALVVDALLEAVAAGTGAAAREFISRHTTPAYRAAAPLDAHAAELARMHREIGRAEVVDLRRLPSGEREVHLRSLEGGARWVLRLEMDDAPPHAVSRIRWRDEALTGALDARMRSEVLASLIESVEGMYVSPDTAAMITAHLRARAAAGAYDALTDRGALAEVLTRDLRAVNRDGHLYVRDATSGPVAGGAGVPAAPPVSDEGPAALGFTRVERLPGNVGYIEIAAPLVGRPGRDAEDRALVGEVVRQMEGADAVIIDLRGSPGGSALLANHLVSHFLPAGTHLFTVESRLSGNRSERRAAAEVPGPRLLSVPVYVLTSQRTFSAGEDIAFSFASQGRATLVGESTGGGGRNNTLVRLAHGMMASISATRVIDPRTGGEAWERVGVPPTLEVPEADALQAALRHAGK
jgi:retinol-binding protein 3